MYIIIIMVRVAICLFGNLGHTERSGNRTPKIIGKENLNENLLNEPGAYHNPESGYKHLKNKIIDNYDTDVFCHCWNTEAEDSIKKLYKPKKYLFEQQKSFDLSLDKYNIDENERDIDKWKHLSENAKKGYKYAFQTRNNWNRTIEVFKIQAFRTSSRWYSTKEVLRLKNEYEKENNFEYDFVLICRYDSFWNFPHHDKKNTNILFDLLKLDTKYTYVESRGNRIDAKISVQDLWILTNSKDSNYFLNMFDERTNYCIRCPISIKEIIDKYKIPYKLI